MVIAFKELAGLPATGPMAVPFPSAWGALGREGKVVEFRSAAGSWVGNFRPGLGGVDAAHACPDGRHVLVVAAGDAWMVDAERRAADVILPAVDATLEVPGSSDLILSRQGLALVRLEGSRVIWHSRRISWDGFDDLRIEGSRIVGQAFDPMNDAWVPFAVDLRTGASDGGSYPIELDDSWERLGG